MLKYLFHVPVLKAIKKDWKAIDSRLKLYSLLAFYHNAYTFKQWLKRKYFKAGHPDYVIYTFWFHANTTGAALLSQKEKVRIVTRAHGYDIFDERVIFRSHYLREFTLSRIENVFVCSQTGADYISNGYRQFAHKIKASYLGTVKLYEGYATTNENPAKLTFLSVSCLHPVKRVPLIYIFLSYLAYRFPNIEFEWIHIGDGEDKDKVEAEIKKRNPDNLTVRLVGTLPNEEVQKLYLQKPIDWFIHLCSSEGLRIALCEALSYGVPVIATDVGGVHEVVNQDVGLLLREPTEIETFIIEISKLITDRRAYLKLRTNVVERWKQCFNAEQLRRKFVEEISQA